MQITKVDKDEHKLIEVDVHQVIGLDFEPSDRSVGIFSASYLLGFKDRNNNEFQLLFGESEWAKLLDAIKEHIHDFED